jgi:uncharacterized membrane protein YcgQ (UPF0703/DUF1980 family)
MEAVIGASSQSKQHIYTLELSKYINPEYLPLMNDLSRMIAIQIVIHLMYFFRAPSVAALFSAAFFELLLYIVLGVMFYWLVVRKFVAFA